MSRWVPDFSPRECRAGVSAFRALGLGKVVAQASACDGAAKAPRGLTAALLYLLALASGHAAPIAADSTGGAALFQSLSWMRDQMKFQGISWPRFSGTEMANLIACLNQGK